MRIRRVYPSTPTFTARCVKCGKPVPSGEAFADLDGPAFQAYYCPLCVPTTKDKA